MIKVIETIDHLAVLDAYKLVEADIMWTDMGFKGRQVGLQYKDNEDPWSSAVGRSSGAELTSINLNPFFKNTVFEDLINKYKLAKTRLMWVGPYACYSMHKDETPRIHIPLVTNPNCYFVFSTGSIKYMHPGAVWWADTRMRHTFMNCSDQPRLHLVGAVES